MKFNIYLQENLIVEWKDFYINYSSLKKILKLFENKYKLTKKNERHERLKNYTIQPDDDMTLKLNELSTELTQEDERILLECFSKQMKLEIKKVEFLFYENTKYYNNRIKKIREQLEFINKTKELMSVKWKLENSIKEIFKELNYMKKYIELNLKAYTKIMKKFKKCTKILGHETNIEYTKQILEELESIINNNSNLSNAIQILSLQQSDIEKIFDANFFDKYSFNSTKVLKDYGSEVQFTHLQSFVFGLFMGIMAVLFILSIIIGSHYKIDMDDDAKFKIIFPIFRGYLCFILYFWFLGLNVYVWNLMHINYKLAFGFDDYRCSTVIQIFTRASVFTFVFAVMLLCYMISRAKIPVLYDVISFLPLDLTPLICWLSVIIYLFSPFKNFNYVGRVYLFNLFFECMSSWTHRIDFRHIWFTDQLTSLIGPMRDLEYTFCYYTHYFNTFEEKKRLCSNRRPIVVLLACYPHFMRLLQCARVCYDEGKLFPSIINCGKYFFSILLGTSSYFASTVPFFSKTWILICLVSSTYSYTWDIKCDYTLLQRGPNYPLRNKIVYAKNKYYIAMVLNFFMRFAWSLTISPDYVYKWVRPEFLLLILYLTEAFRRGMWNFFRVEIKHIDLCKDFKVCPSVHLPLKKCSDGTFKLSEISHLNIPLGSYDKIGKLMVLNSFKYDANNINIENRNKKESTNSLNLLGLKKPEMHEKIPENDNYKKRFQKFLDLNKEDTEKNMEIANEIIKRLTIK